MQKELNADEFKLFQLIWKRTVASQMANARGRRISITVEGEGCVFQVGGRVIDFPGYLRAYVEGSDDPDAELADKETLLPDVAVGELLNCTELEAKSHTTAPPSRFSEASLTAALEEKGIGRPSTYASIIDTILHRGYVFKRGNALVPTWVAFSVVKLLEKHLPGLIDYTFTAQMEDDLDSISRGEANHTDYLSQFYFGNGAPGLKKQLDHKLEEIDARQIGTIPIGKPDDGEEIVVRVGRYAPYLEQGERRATLPDEMPPDELTLERAIELLEQSAKADEPLGVCPDTKKPVFLKVGRFGPYIQRGTPDDEEKPKNASLLKGMEPDDVTLDLALQLLNLPRSLGDHPETGKSVRASVGRYGPYVVHDGSYASLKEDSVLEVQLPRALELLEAAAARKGGRAKSVLKELGEHPDGGAIQVLDGRYGPYVKHNKINATIPKEMKPEEVTLEQAVAWIAEKAGKKGTKKRSTKKSTAKKSTTKKSTAKKGTAKKSTAKKKPSTEEA